MEAARARGSKIRFDLSNMEDIAGVLKGTGKYGETVTGAELRYLRSHWAEFEGTVEFYRGGAKVAAPW